MTDYILNHAVGRSIHLLYEAPSGITSRTLHVFFVNDTIIRGMENGHPKTFRRDRILSAGYLQEGLSMQHPAITTNPSPSASAGSCP